jgi:hypothetical protein
MLIDVGFVGNTGNSDGRPSGFNNFGQVAFGARFDDGSQGIFVSNAVARPQADFDGDGDVDGDDLWNWKAGFGTSAGAAHSQGDANGDGDSDGADFLAWQQQFGLAPDIALPATPAVPEPDSSLVAAACILGSLLTFRRSIS